MNSSTWQNPGQLIVAQDIKNIVNYSVAELRENTITELISRGDIISFNDKGEIVSRTNILSDKQQEIVRVSASIKDAIDHRLKDYTTALPPVNNAIASTEKKYFDIKDSHDIIVASSCENGFIYVSKNTRCDTPTLSGYKGVIRKLNKEKGELADKYAKLKSQYDKMNRQKRRRLNIIPLCVVLVVGLIFLCGNIKYLEKSLFIEKMQREKAENELDSLFNLCEDTQPFIIKSTSFDFKTGVLSFDYYGYCTKTIILEVKAICPYNTDSSIKYFTVKKGNNSSSINMSKNLNSLNSYTFVFFAGENILGGTR